MLEFRFSLNTHFADQVLTKTPRTIEKRLKQAFLPYDSLPIHPVVQDLYGGFQ